MRTSFRCWCICILSIFALLTIASRFDRKRKPLRTHCPTTLPIVKDRQIENALASLFSRELGYTLIGKKPVSIDVNDDYYLYKHPHVVKKVLNFLKKTFKDSPGFILKTKLHKDGSYRIELTNKKSFTNIISERPKLWALVREKFGSIDAFLERVNSSKKGVFDLLHSHASMRGILLGYGKTNTDYFCRRYAVGNYLKKHPFSCIFFPSYRPRPRSICFRFFGSFTLEKHFFLGPKPPKRAGFDSLEDEWRWIREVEWDLSDECRPEPPYFIELPYYICCHGGDSEQTWENYKKASGQLASLFCNRSFTEVITEKAAN